MDNFSILGLGKTLFNSSACLLLEKNGKLEFEIALTERISRKKGSGAWPEQAIKNLLANKPTPKLTAENRDVVSPTTLEDHLSNEFPFYEYLKKNNLDIYSSHFNRDIKFVTHHLSHAYAAVVMSPFEKSLILVVDGAGSNVEDFQDLSLSHLGPPSHFMPKMALEECSAFIQTEGSLTPVLKNWQFFENSPRLQNHHFSEGLGSLYEKSSEFIFDCKQSAGKVMGLAAYGNAHKISNRWKFLESLDWNLKFTGNKKDEWENSGRFSIFADLAASVQNHFEESIIAIVTNLKKRFPEIDHLIITGGCALNCTTNMKLHQSRLFSEIYIPPFPGDESISLGSASFIYHNSLKRKWSPWPQDRQNSYFGLKTSVPIEDEIRVVFANYLIEQPASITLHTATQLANGKIIGWFQDRSECGPRALGNRSLLARPDRKGIKAYLNNFVKFRESFRPYGCSCLHSRAHQYFEVDVGFNNPFMSFATPVRMHYRDLLREVIHVDQTCRMQTVKEAQNPLFYDLLCEFGKLTDLFCLLNTSLNVMGEPIAETIIDAKKMLEQTPIDALVIGNFYISRRTVANNV